MKYALLSLFFIQSVIASSFEISGKLHPSLKIESVEAVLGSNILCNSKVRTGSIKQTKNGYKAKINIKGYSFLYCDYEVDYIVVNFVREFESLGQKYKTQFSLRFTTSSNGTVDFEGADLVCEIKERSGESYSDCNGNLPRQFRHSANVAFKGVNLDLKIPAPPVMEVVDSVYEVKKWNLKFTLFQNAEGKVGAGSVLKVSGRSSKMNAGNYILSEVNLNHKKEIQYVSGNFLNDDGEDTYFAFSPLGEENTFYTKCDGKQYYLSIRDRRFEAKRERIYCAD